MQCPVCRNREHADIHLKSDQFIEELMNCRVCGTSWSVNHGVVEVIKDGQAASFLQGASECVEGDDYNRS